MRLKTMITFSQNSIMFTDIQISVLIKALSLKILLTTVTPRNVWKTSGFI